MEYIGRLFKTDLGAVLALADADEDGEVRVAPLRASGAEGPRLIALSGDDFLEGDLSAVGAPENAPADAGKLRYVPSGSLGEAGARVSAGALERVLRAAALEAAYRHYEVKHAPKKPFVKGDRIPYAGRFFDEREIENLIDSSLDFWLTTGRYADRFEKSLARTLGLRHAILTNSGSSANLLAFMALTSPILGERRVKRGDEIITVAAGFPTTVAPAIQFGAVPVFVDITLPTYNIDVSRLEAALSHRTRAVMVAHTLGNPFELEAVREFCDKHKLFLIEDNCDALGSRYKYKGEWRLTGTIGDLGTSSFYPPHHITMGEGGAVYADKAMFKRILESFRDWGRDCWCPSGQDNTCGKRFSWDLGELPHGYDHKYVYSHFGYNLKVTDMQAAIGCAQLEKLSDFAAARRRNWTTLREGLDDLGDVFVLPEPTENSEPSWFGFLLTLREDAPFERGAIVNHLEERGVQTRMLFAGNLLRHPCFDEMRARGEGFRVVGSLENTDRVMRSTFWTGVYPGMTPEMLDHTIESIKEFVASVRTRGAASPS